jgi:hypothetical protein
MKVDTNILINYVVFEKQSTQKAYVVAENAAFNQCAYKTLQPLFISETFCNLRPEALTVQNTQWVLRQVVIVILAVA